MPTRPLSGPGSRARISKRSVAVNHGQSYRRVVVRRISRRWLGDSVRRSGRPPPAPSPADSGWLWGLPAAPVLGESLSPRGDVDLTGTDQESCHRPAFCTRPLVLEGSAGGTFASVPQSVVGKARALLNSL
jgi:hypothetical protein